MDVLQGFVYVCRTYDEVADIDRHYMVHIIADKDWEASCGVMWPPQTCLDQAQHGCSPTGSLMCNRYLTQTLHPTCIESAAVLVMVVAGTGVDADTCVHADAGMGRLEMHLHIHMCL